MIYNTFTSIFPVRTVRHKPVKLCDFIGTRTEKDIDELRGFGLKDEEILDVILASTARNFFSKTLEAAGAVPDSVYAELEPELLQALSLGQPIEK